MAKQKHIEQDGVIVEAFSHSTYFWEDENALYKALAR